MGNFSKAWVWSLLCAGVWHAGADGTNEPAGGSIQPDAHRAPSGGLEIGNSPMWEVQVGGEIWYGAHYAQQRSRLLVMTTDGQVHQFRLGHDSTVRELAVLFRPANQMQVSTILRREFGRQFSVHRTAHYLICHNTTEAFARQTGKLVEQIYRIYFTYFGSRGIKVIKPAFPMVIIIFDTQQEFRAYIQKQPSIPKLTQVTGYYSMDTNRVTMFNASGGGGSNNLSAKWQNLSTVVHEATHQIAFNAGCLPRFAESPLWLVEGIAMYFETPEIRGRELVWHSAGKINLPRLSRFEEYRKRRRSSGALESLIVNDQRFRLDVLASDAYAEGWALTYFLINKRSGPFSRYLKKISLQPPLEAYSEEERLKDFQKVFGNIRRLDASFLEYLDTVGNTAGLP